MRRFRKKYTLRKVMGIHSCLEVLKVRPKTIRSIYIQNNWRNHHELKKIVEQARRYKVDYFEQNKVQLASWGIGHQGVALIVEESPILSPHVIKEKDRTVFVFIDRLEDARNLGAIIRTSWLMGVDGIFLPEQRGSIHQINSLSCKVASGGAEHIPVEFLSHPKAWIKKLKKDGFWIYALDASGTASLWEELFHSKTVLVAGAESKGIQPSILSLCDRSLFIPQRDLSASYNLSVSVALGLTQIQKTYL